MLGSPRGEGCIARPPCLAWVDAEDQVLPVVLLKPAGIGNADQRNGSASVAQAIPAYQIHGLRRIQDDQPEGLARVVDAAARVRVGDALQGKDLVIGVAVDGSGEHDAVPVDGERIRYGGYGLGLRSIRARIFVRRPGVEAAQVRDVMPVDERRRRFPGAERARPFLRHGQGIPVERHAVDGHVPVRAGPVAGIDAVSVAPHSQAEDTGSFDADR